MAGFRKSLFGFNTEDVLSYIEETHKQTRKKEDLLNKNIDDLNSTIDMLKSELDEVISAKEAVEAELKKFTDKQDEIEKMTENIGKLYLVSQANAKAIIDNAKESKDLAEEEIKNNLTAIETAHKSLEAIKLNVAANSEEFKQRIDGLTELLQKTKTEIKKRSADTEKEIKEFDLLLTKTNK